MAIDLPPNILSPETSGDAAGSIWQTVRTVVAGVGSLVAPILIAFMKVQADENVSNLKKQHEEEMESLKAEHLRLLKSCAQVPVDTKLTKALLPQILQEEQQREQRHLAQLSEIETAVRIVLDMRCSRVNPTKSKKQRHALEEELLQTSSSEFRPGITNIFEFDHRHCGGGKYGNGQLWRVWMQVWQAQAEAQKYRRVVERLQEASERPNLSKPWSR